MKEMKGFQFRFESVEKIRKRKEDEALQLLGRARGELKAVQERKASLQHELSNALKRREALANIPVSPDDFALEEAFISGTKVRIRQAEIQEVRAVKIVEKATRGYLHARRDMKVMETIRENDFQEFKKARARREMKDADEVASIRAARDGEDS